MARKSFLMSLILAVILFCGVAFANGDGAVGASTYQYFTIQPGPQDGKDSTIYKTMDDLNFGDWDALEVARSDFDESRTLIQFDLSRIPAGSTLVRATMDLYMFNSGLQSQQTHKLAVNALSGRWGEMDVTWINQPGFFYDNEVHQYITKDGWQSLDITPLAQSWFSNPDSNNGLLVRSYFSGDQVLMGFRSSDFISDSSLRPKLTLKMNVVPEPVSFVLFGLGGAVLAVRRKTGKRASA